MATKGAARPSRQTRPKVTKTAIPTQPKPIDASVIILNFNTPKLTIDCVNSVITHTKHVSYEIIVVDNGSSDDSLKQFTKQLPKKVTVVNVERNLGFGPGNNVGAQAAQGDYLFFINSDTLFTENCLASLTKFADLHPEFPIIGPVVYLPKSTTIQPASFGKLPTLSRLLTRRQNSRCTLNERQEYTATEWVTGAALFITTDVFFDVGGFDSRFFMYFEDQDLCATVRTLGGQVAVVNAAHIIHLGGKSISKKKIRFQHYDESQLKYFLKHRGLIVAGLLLMLRWPWRWLRSDN